MILIIDNYDSFAYNLYQLIGILDSDITIIRNDEKSIEEIEALRPKLIVLSPGPGKPRDAGICIKAIKYFKGKIPIFGVCLGHQAICEAYGAEVSYASTMMHGKTSEIRIDRQSRLFVGFEDKMRVARYHSLIAVRETIPEILAIIATDEEGQVMAVEDRENRVYGVQFHPESILTPDGRKIIQNLLEDIKND